MTKRGAQMTDGTAPEWPSSQTLSGMRGKWIVACKVKIVGKADNRSVPFVLRVPADESLAL